MTDSSHNLWVWASQIQKRECWIELYLPRVSAAYIFCIIIYSDRIDGSYARKGKIKCDNSSVLQKLVEIELGQVSMTLVVWSNQSNWQKRLAFPVVSTHYLANNVKRKESNGRKDFWVWGSIFRVTWTTPSTPLLVPDWSSKFPQRHREAPSQQPSIAQPPAQKLLGAHRLPLGLHWAKKWTRLKVDCVICSLRPTFP